MSLVRIPTATVVIVIAASSVLPPSKHEAREEPHAHSERYSFLGAVGSASIQEAASTSARGTRYVTGW